MRLLILVLMSASLAAGCATQGAGESTRRPSAFADAGAQTARLRCAECHAIDLSNRSPKSAAPPFRTLAIRFNEITWERAMTAISAGGHDEMPAVSLTDSEIRDLKTFLNTLR